MLLAPAARAIDSGDILVASVKGEVHVIMSGSERPVKPGSVIEPPATVRTGADGAIELRQGRTSVSVGPDTLLEFPALQARGGPIDRIIQPSGSAFYNVGKREGRKLRVETPYLVGVVKGTQFNVAVQPEGTTISLFEGLLDVRASDESSAVDLRAGEIASRKRDGRDIGVMKMDAPVPPRPAPGANRAPATPTAAPVAAHDSGAVHATEEEQGTIDALGQAVGDAARVEVATSIGNLTEVAPVELAVSDSIGAGLNTGASPAAESGSATIDLGNAASVGAPAVVDVASTPNVDLGASVGVDAGNAVAIDASAGAAVNVGTTPAVATNVDVGANVGGVTAGVSAGVDTSTGNVDLGVNVGGVVNVDIKVGDDEDDDHGGSSRGGDQGNGKDKGKGNDGNIVDNLLDTLTKGPRKK